MAIVEPFSVAVEWPCWQCLLCDGELVLVFDRAVFWLDHQCRGDQVE